ncbi:MAG: ABC transporter ATP-binding protein [Chlorobi bacterium]|nr:ABC transporter ATP-binding protein [Chlorobiota bacterium]
MKSLFTLKKYFYARKNKLLAGVFFILLSTVSQVMIPLFLKSGIDSILNAHDYSRIAYYAGLILAASAFSGVFRFFTRFTIGRLSREIETDLRLDLWKHLQTLPLSYFKETPTGDLMAHATNDISAVRMFIGPAILHSVDTALKTSFIIVIIASLNFELTIYSLLPLPFLSFFVYKLSGIIHHKFAAIQSKFSDLTAKAQESFSGIRIIKSYVRTENEISEFNKLSSEYLDKNMEKIKVQAWFMPVLLFIAGTSGIIVIWAGGNMAINNSLTLGELSAFISYLVMLIWPMITFGWVLNIIQQSAASMKRLNIIFNRAPDVSDTEAETASQFLVKGEIEFKNVSLRYHSNLPFILKNINIKIPAGSTVAIIGRTGSGKSSLVNLLPRLYDVTSGKIFIDGTEIKKIPLKVLRKSMGVVPQDAFLFSDSIEENILYGAEARNNGLFEAAVRISRIDKDVRAFADGYKSVIGEKGVTLSGGQKQRVALARALAVNPKILILDDSFSAIDAGTEEEILNNLKEFKKDKTLIIISHRISTVKNADKIYALDRGSIAEEGNHSQLLKLNGLYADLYRKQLLEKELDELG